MNPTPEDPRRPALDPDQSGQSPFTDSDPTHATDPEKAMATLSQWQLIRLRFRRHHLAVYSLYFLGVLYFMAIFVEFFAPYRSMTRDLDYIYAPPQLPAWSFTEGFHTHPVERRVDPLTLKNYYLEHTEVHTPLGFFVRGQPYHLLGIIPMERRFFGVDHAHLARNPTTTEYSGSHTFYFLGTDKFGHDLLSRILYGARISLSIGLVGIAIVFVIGLTMGGISGYIGGHVDNLIQRSMEVLNGFPELPLWLALAAVLPADWSPLRIYFAISIMLSLINWTGLARVVRGKILSLREEDYAVAARLLGASHVRIVARHLIPGFTSHIIVVLSLAIPAMILGETALSFLGLGLRPPIVSWGVMLQDCMHLDVVANYPWLLMPVVMIILTVLCFNFLGDGLRDAADPYSSR